jgi:uncharacterized protein (TIGR03382 family)
MRISIICLSFLLLSSRPAAAQSEVKLSFTPSGTGSGSNYEEDEKLIIAAWIEDQARNFVATIDGHGSNPNHADSLIEFIGANNDQLDIDALSQATSVGYPPVSYYWDLKNEQGQKVANGTYYVRMEGTDSNNPNNGDNNLYELQVTIADQNDTQTGAGGGFTDVSAEYTYVFVDPALCGNGDYDVGETCDDTAAAQYACPAVLADCGTPDDYCYPYAIAGTAEACTAECVVGEQITAPINDDQCCPAGYYYDDDNDCEVEGGGGGGPDAGPGDPGGGPAGVDENGRSKVVQGGCSTSGDGGPLAVLLLLGLALATRRRS